MWFDFFEEPQCVHVFYNFLARFESVQALICRWCILVYAGLVSEYVDDL